MIRRLTRRATVRLRWDGTDQAYEVIRQRTWPAPSEDWRIREGDPNARLPFVKPVDLLGQPAPSEGLREDQRARIVPLDKACGTSYTCVFAREHDGRHSFEQFAVEAARQHAPSEGLRERIEKSMLDIAAAMPWYDDANPDYTEAVDAIMAALARQPVAEVSTQPAPSEGLDTPTGRWFRETYGARGYIPADDLKAKVRRLGHLTPEDWKERRGGDPIARTINAVFDIIDEYSAVRPAPSEGLREVPQGSVPRSTGPIHSVERPAPSEGLRAAIEAALLELGVPDEDYPAPVANAVTILRDALARQPAPDR